VNVAIVTGAARGIGAATASLLAEQGMAVALLDVEEAALAETTGRLAEKGHLVRALRCDVGLRTSVEAAILEVETQLGAVQVLVNNAGVGGPFHRVDEVSDEEWDWIINTNLKSVFLFTRNLLPKMKAQGYGRIVNVASIQGFLGSARSSTYVASKHGMVGYTRTIAAEWGAYGITANAVCPGYVDTALGIQPAAVQDYLAKVMAKSPVQRVAQPREIAELIAFLASPNAGYLNGAVIPIDGGITAHVGIT
jgi:3-oxoacyl-[acyl-carrier protein] reductase